MNSEYLTTVEEWEKVKQQLEPASKWQTQVEEAQGKIREAIQDQATKTKEFERRMQISQEIMAWK